MLLRHYMYMCCPRLCRAMCALAHCNLWCRFIYPLGYRQAVVQQVAAHQLVMHAISWFWWGCEHSQRLWLQEAYHFWSKRSPVNPEGYYPKNFPMSVPKVWSCAVL